MYLLIAEHFHTGKGPCTVSEIAASAKVEESLVQNILEKFMVDNLIYEVEGDAKGYIPARGLDTITLDSLIASVDEDLTQHFTKALDAPLKFVQIYEKMQSNQAEVLKNTTVSSLFDAIE